MIDYLMECYICSKKLSRGYLCESHAKELNDMLHIQIGLVEEVTWKHHCTICGEYENRKIIEVPSAGYFCDKDIIEAYKLYT